MSRDYNHANRILELENICKENPELNPYYVKLSDEIEKSFKTTLDEILNGEDFKEIIKNKADLIRRVTILINIDSPSDPYENPLR